MTLRLLFQAATGQWDAAMKGIYAPIARASSAAIRDAGNQVKTEGRAAIASAGFGSKWQNALRVNIYPPATPSVDAAAWIFHKIPYAGVFEHGATIPGSPLLWIPLSTTPAKIGSQSMSVRNYLAMIGPLQIIRPPGRPPMMVGFIQGGVRGTGKISVSKLRQGTQARRQPGKHPGLVSVPLFVGVPAVSLHKRFDLAPIFERARQGLGKSYLTHIEQENG
jgi:hypothetical protein